MQRIFLTVAAGFLVLLMGTGVGFPTSALAVIGDIKPGTPISPVPQGNGRAVAYDGEDTLYYTIFPDTNIYMVTTAGLSLGAIPTDPGRVQCGSLSWDPNTNQLWCGSYDGTGDVYTVDPITGIATMKFSDEAFGGFADDSCYGSGDAVFIDGLAYDASDNTLWLSGDAAQTIYHVNADGTIIGSSAVPNHPDTALTGCNTGITVAPGGFLELGLQAGPDVGPHYIAKVAKADTSAIIVSFVALLTDNPGIEDLSYDPNTFAPRCAVWSNQFGEANVLTAWDVQCTRSKGYWKNHSDDALEFLPISLGDGTDTGFCPVVDTAEEVRDIMRAARSKEAAFMLEAQLLAAKLNVAMGDIPPDDLAAIAPIIVGADLLLSRNSCDPDTGKNGVDRAEATALSSALDAFNNKYTP